jgi:XapX domain-containing protein
MPVLRYSIAGTPTLDWSVPFARDDCWLRYCRPHPAAWENRRSDGYAAMKSMIGIVLAFALGFACRAFGIPSPAPPLILGALLVMTMTIGYIAVDRWMVSPSPARS